MVAGIVGAIGVERREDAGFSQRTEQKRYESCPLLIRTADLPGTPLLTWSAIIPRYGEGVWSVDRIEGVGSTSVTLHLLRPLSRRSELTGLTRGR